VEGEGGEGEEIGEVDGLELDEVVLGEGVAEIKEP
jgi:hypothetical protein